MALYQLTFDVLSISNKNSQNLRELQQQLYKLIASPMAVRSLSYGKGVNNWE